jgi:hypothetical protein
VGRSQAFDIAAVNAGAAASVCMVVSQVITRLFSGGAEIQVLEWCLSPLHLTYFVSVSSFYPSWLSGEKSFIWIIL